MINKKTDSQPIAGLQLLMSDGQWKYVRHYPDHIIVQLGDSMEFLTGVLKALPHRVLEPPEGSKTFEKTRHLLLCSLPPRH
ncbi:hypothetical protein K435DRAFT_86152 [Dendrothele bispora CBS 962.96]|uniref:Isopenicillin N synthase-like Fe(2+) 2OG dioxygenase domain-containing protein n=1 Tax=Dendrothele bispora (strain CBS 962.96) TaxID=1314807 RepID=A0A4S8M3M6_DENBC|nr:hypothetical protein K435DRAFT_86152 [Dendrothele bispora CBS 962.96]